MQRVKVGLVQINNSFEDACYLPYSVGLLQAYVKKYARESGQFMFLDPIYCRITVEEAVSRLIEADIVGFSVYVWNFRLSLAIAAALKQQNPKTLIVFGGPHVPDRAEGFLRNNPFVDLACHGEGEKVFLSILENYYSKSGATVPSVSRLENGVYIRSENPQRILDLSSLPSPYLEGIFDGLLNRHNKYQWLGLWETNRGCPFSCAYCDWGSSSHTRLVTFDIDRLTNEMRWFANNRIEFVFCCDSNFGLLPRDLEIVELVTDASTQRGFPKAFSVQSTKNALERSYKVQKKLSEAGLNKGVNLALQTVDEITLKNVGRQNVSLETFRELQRRFARDGVETFTDIILGLPGETYDSFVTGIDHIIESGQHNRVQFINLSILPNAPMAEPDFQQLHGLVAVETKIINIHGASTVADGDIFEAQELVIATNTMPKDDWVKTRVFSWLTSFLYFDKVLQIPFILLHQVCGCSYRELVECFLMEKNEQYPQTSQIGLFLRDEAESIQKGGGEYYHSRDWLNIYWPHDEYLLIKLILKDKLEVFYTEAEFLLGEMLGEKGLGVPTFLHESIMLNCALLKRPFQTENLTVNLSYNIYEYYKSTLIGEKITLENKPMTYHIDRTTEIWSSLDNWLREVIWYGNKRATYLYPVKRINNQSDSQLRPK